MTRQLVSIYEALAQAVGLEAGWRVLDAGCGSGSITGGPLVTAA